MSAWGFLFASSLIAVISLVITFVLFRILSSQAQAKGKILNHEIAYGGALAGFVLVYWAQIILASWLTSVFGNPSKHNIAGKWSIQLVPFNEVRKQNRSLYPENGDLPAISGTAVIGQLLDDRYFSICADLFPSDFENTQGHSDNLVTFRSLVGWIRDDQIIFVYENDQRAEKGLAEGTISNYDSALQQITMTYTDLWGKDANGDPTGRLVLKKNRY